MRLSENMWTSHEGTFTSVSDFEKFWSAHMGEVCLQGFLPENL